MDKKNNTKPSAHVSLTEHLSALLDNETGSFEQRRVLDELASNSELRQKLSSYALIGEVMRTTETTLTADSSFLAGIHDRLEAEDEYHQVQVNTDVVGSANSANNSGNKKQPANDDSWSFSSWLRPVGGLALAASVAAVAFLGFQSPQQKSFQQNSPQLNGSNMLDAGMAKTAETVPASQIVATNEFKQADARTRMLLKRYVDSHMQYASNTSFVPSVRVIAYAN